MQPQSIDAAPTGCASTEARLLLGCARLALEPPLRDRVLESLRSIPDWARVMEMAERHGLLPLLYRHLNALPQAVVPKAVLVELWGRHETTAIRNRAMASELLSILELFDAHGIDAIPYKGPALAERLYGDVAMREFGDLDILLRPRDVLPARALLQSRGYIAAYPLEPAVESAFLRSSAQYHLVMCHEDHGRVELHWKTDADFPVERSADGRWWASLGKAPLMGGRVRCFSTQELLLVLCIHGSKHHWSSVGWLVDIAELLRQRPPIDWPRVREDAARLGCVRRLQLGLHLAHVLLDAPLPRDVLSTIAVNNEIERFAASITARLFTPDIDGIRPLESLRFHLGLFDKNRQRFRFCVNTILAPSLAEWTRWPLPRALFFLYPPLRLMRLARKYLPR